MIYVDDMGLPAEVENRHIPRRRVVHRSAWSHLFNDGPDEELHRFAEGLGLRRAYFQNPGEWYRHYDVTEGKRRLAVTLGAVEVTSGEGVRILRSRDADQRAGAAFKRGELLAAAEVIQAARRCYPERRDLWTDRLGQITSAMRQANRADRDAPKSLEDIVRDREARHGIAPGHPARQEIAAWNSAQILRSAPEIGGHLATAEHQQATHMEAGQ